jgi:hypothetical protein
MLRSEKTRPKISFSSSACESPRCGVLVLLTPSVAPPVEERDALEVGRADFEVAEAPEEDVGRGVQRRLYMHSAGWC